MDKRIKPWVNKKIIEYIGEEEPTLTDFICQKVMAQSQPQNILNDVAMVSTLYWNSLFKSDCKKNASKLVPTIPDISLSYNLPIERNITSLKYFR